MTKTTFSPSPALAALLAGTSYQAMTEDGLTERSYNEAKIKTWRGRSKQLGELMAARPTVAAAVVGLLAALDGLLAEGVEAKRVRRAGDVLGDGWCQLAALAQAVAPAAADAAKAAADELAAKDAALAEALAELAALKAAQAPKAKTKA